MGLSLFTLIVVGIAAVIVSQALTLANKLGDYFIFKKLPMERLRLYVASLAHKKTIIEKMVQKYLEKKSKLE